ncbi:MAG: hypothetical protein J6X18_16955 [Bacteroidales bacterium]|nr:hypothetical protein [Bacteroidales bacterium]
MKKLIYSFILALCMSSCINGGTEGDPYELEEYNGYTVVGMMSQKTGGEMQNVFMLSKDNESVKIEVSEYTFKRYSLGDVINDERPVTENKNEQGGNVVSEQTFKIVAIGNHEYIVYGNGGICHNEDCPCKTANQEEEK